MYSWTSAISTCSKVTRGFSLYNWAGKIVPGSMTLVWKWSKCPSLRLRNLSTKPDFSRWKGAATANFLTDRHNSSCVTTDKFTGTVPVAMLTLSNSYEYSRNNDNNWIHHKCMQMQPQKSDKFTSRVHLKSHVSEFTNIKVTKVPKQASPTTIKSVQRKMWKRIKDRLTVVKLD